MVDQQNVNARYIDKFNSGGTTSIKTHNPPGGKSTFSLGWGNDNETKTSSNKITKITKNEDLYNYSHGNNTENKKSFKDLGNNKQTDNSNSNNIQEKTSVRVRHAPGGQSSIKFG